MYAKYQCNVITNKNKKIHTTMHHAREIPCICLHSSVPSETGWGWPGMKVLMQNQLYWFPYLQKFA